jgi:hypothetical protein
MDRLQQRLASRAGLVVLSIALGLANTLALFGWDPINPSNTAWVFGDNATYYVGWALYRHDPHLSFPLAWTDRVGYPVGTSIALLDAIPLVAVLLRPLGWLLPEPFQYLGLYSALCFVLQAYFGLSLCRRLFPGNPAFILLGGVFFLLSAPLTWRAFGHTALLSHWLILAALDSYFRDPGEMPVRWLARFWGVLAIAAAITPYVAAMCFLLTLAGIARLLLERRCRWPFAGVLAVLSLGVLYTSLASIGVLVARDSSTYWAPGYGLFSLNLNSLINPMAYGSILLPALPVIHAAQVEGYNYLGLGILALLVLNLARRPQAVLWLGNRRLLPLVGLALVCTVLAASATVSLGASTLFEVQLPTAVMAAVHGLRASGRLFWPAYYLIVAAALSLTFWVWKAPYGGVILAVALAVQVADLGPLRTKVRAVLNQRFANGLVSPAWTDLGRKYDNLMLIPPYQCGPYTGPGGVYSYVTFGKLAAAERMRTNSYYAARYTRPELLAHCVDLLRTQLAGTLDARSAYVVTDGVKTVWDLYGMRSHRCEVADGFNLCTPVTSPGAVPAAAPAAPAYAMGKVLDFRETGTARNYMTLGWGTSNSAGTWTEGPMAMLRLGLEPGELSRPLILTVEATGFTVPEHPRLFVDVVVNGQPVDQWTMRYAFRPASRWEARIPAALTAGRHDLNVEFRFRNPEAPLYLGAGPSSNFLGLNVRSVVLRPE